MDGWVETGWDGELRASEGAKEGQDKHGVECAGGVDRMVASAESGNAFGQNFFGVMGCLESGRVGLVFWIPLMSKEVCELAIRAEGEPYKGLWKKL